MKSLIKLMIIAAFLLISMPILKAQTPPHPNGGNAPNATTNNPVGAGAPIGSGTLLLIGLAGLYGGSKTYFVRKIMFA